jgi:hypothetical protein
VRWFLRTFERGNRGWAGGTVQAASVEVDGDRATMLAADESGWRVRVPFANEDGEWRIDDFFGVSGPPPAEG